MAGIEARLGMSLDDIINKTKEVAKVGVRSAWLRARVCARVREPGTCV